VTTDTLKVNQDTASAGTIFDTIKDKSFVIMGVLDLNLGLSSDGGKYNTMRSALVRVEEMILEGADIIEVGALQSLDNSVTEQQELARVIPIIDAIRSHFAIPIAVNTSSPAVMQAAVVAGADMINDIKALSCHGALSTVASLNVPICLMHMIDESSKIQDAPVCTDSIDKVKNYLAKRVLACQAAGINKILIDPGIGFSSTLDDNCRLLRDLGRFKDIECPILVDASRKSMLGQILNKPVHDRANGSLSAAVVAYLKGAKVFRVHDVSATSDALKVAAAIQKGV